MKNKSKYVVVEVGGSQYRVAEGDEIVVNQLKETKESSPVKIGKVLLLVDNEKVTIGHPSLDKVTVTARVVKNYLGKKIEVMKFKAKTGYRRHQGFRPRLSRLLIESIK